MAELRVETVSLAGFRNHEMWTSDLSPRLTVLVGANAAGKTNILEALMVAVTGTSFRSFSWDDLIKRGADRADVSIKAVRDGVPLDLKMSIEKTGTREFLLNGRRRKSAAEVTDRVPVVAFVPEDLSLSKGASEIRRASLDALGDRLSRAYAALRLEYSRLVKQRNALLKSGAPESQLSPWDEMVATVGAALTLHRVRLLMRMEQPAREAYRRVGHGEELSVAYQASWKRAEAGAEDIAGMKREHIADTIMAELREGREKERERGITRVGPHRDDVVFSIAGYPARGSASQGQHRTVALAWKMAEVAVVHEVAGVRPLLLLDDVMSELDSTRRTELSAFILEGSQAIITTTNPAYFGDNLLEESLVVRIGEE